MPEDCIFLLSFDLGGGGGGHGGGAGANRFGVIPFCAIENEELHKILRSFLKGHLFFLHSIFHPTKRKQQRRNQQHVKYCIFF